MATKTAKKKAAAPAPAKAGTSTAPNSITTARGQELKLDKDGNPQISGKWQMAAEGTSFTDMDTHWGLAWPIGREPEEKEVPEKGSGRIIAQIIAGSIVPAGTGQRTPLEQAEQDKREVQRENAPEPQAVVLPPDMELKAAKK